MTLETMDEAAVIHYITSAFAGVHVVTDKGNSFFLDDAESKLPFATLVTNDDYDYFSDLGRPMVFRLNIGVSKPTFVALFGAPPSAPGAAGVVSTGHDFTALDQLMPHPVYGHMLWVCVLNPSRATFEVVRPLLAEAYSLAVRRRAKRGPRR